MFRKGIKIFEQNNDFLVWIRLDKTVFNLKDHIMVSAVYLPSEGFKQIYKKYENDIFDMEESSLTKYSKEYDILMLGDFNSRTGVLDDHIAYDDFCNTSSNMQSKYTKLYTNRSNCDLKANKFGKNLLNLCETPQLRKLNGRTHGDSLGNLTSF